MCDTLYKKTDTGYLFAKNSDRSPNEPNLSLFIPAALWQDESLACTYISIPQVKQTYGCIIVRPSWTWGAEMGVNDQGVTIGNEAVFTRAKNKKKPSLIGMDYVRLVLERAENARKGVEIITELLSIYGQGGNCGFDKPFYYDNSYLIADRNEAWILETAGKAWVAKPIADYGNISNRLSIRTEATQGSQDVKKDFYRHNVEPLFTHFSCSLSRRRFGENGLALLEKDDFFGLRQLMQSHHPDDENTLFTKGSLRSLCMHRSVLGDHTTASMVVKVEGGEMSLMLTSASTPCLSLFKPAFLDAHTGIVFDDETSAYGYWLRQEKIRRCLYAGRIDLKDYRLRLHQAQAEIDKLGEGFHASRAKEDRENLVANCLEIEERFLKPYMQIATSITGLSQPKLWRNKNKKLDANVFSRELAARSGK